MNTHNPTHQASQTQLTRTFGLVFAALLFSLPSVMAQDSYTWNGGTDGNWTPNNNWTHSSGGGPALPASPQGYLNFDGSTRLNNTTNFGAGSGGFQIYFKTNGARSP